MVARFVDLEWRDHPMYPDVQQAIVELPNGYSLSIIQGDRVSVFLGPHEYELMELAEGGWPPLSDTEVRGDADRMQRALDEIAARPPRLKH